MKEEETKEGSCDWCSDKGTVYYNEGDWICYGCVCSEINRLRKLLEKGD